MQNLNRIDTGSAAAGAAAAAPILMPSREAMVGRQAVYLTRPIRD